MRLLLDLTGLGFSYSTKLLLVQLLLSTCPVQWTAFVIAVRPRFNGDNRYSWRTVDSTGVRYHGFVLQLHQVN